MIYLQLFSNIFGLRDKLEGDHFSLAGRQIEPTLALSGRRFHYTMLVVELMDTNQNKSALGPVSRKSRKAICKTPTWLFRKAGLFICCKGDKNKNKCEVSCLETSSLRLYKENYVTQNTPEKFRDFRETGPRPGNFSGNINPFVPPIRTRFKLRNLAVTFPFLTPDTY